MLSGNLQGRNSLKRLAPQAVLEPTTPPSPTWTSLDGATILSTDIVPLHYPPCMSAVTASIAIPPGTVTYAGWVSGSVTGLYQVNVTVPAGAASGTPVSVPVSVTISGKTSQAGVTMWVK